MATAEVGVEMGVEETATEAADGGASPSSPGKRVRFVTSTIDAPSTVETNQDGASPAVQAQAQAQAQASSDPTSDPDEDKTKSCCFSFSKLSPKKH